jgi:hypothetical protein
VVVGEELARKAEGGARLREAGPGRLAAWARAGEGGQQEAGMVVQAVDDPGEPAVGQLDGGGVDLPEVVGELPFEPLPGRLPSGRLRGDQGVAPERAVDRAQGRRLDPRPLELGLDPARAPARVPLGQRHDLGLERGRDPARRAARPPRARLQSAPALLQVAAPVAVEARPRSLVAGRPPPPSRPCARARAAPSFSSLIDTTVRATRASRSRLRLGWQG